MRTRVGHFAVVITTVLVVGAAALSIPAAAVGGTAALQFTTYAAEVRVPDNPSVRIPNNLTIEARVKLTAPIAESHLLVDKSTWELGVEPNTGGGYRAKFGIQTSGGWREVKSDALTVGQWYTVAGTYNGAALRIYVDGMYHAFSPASGTIAQNSSPVRMGMLYGNLYWENSFSGILDEVRLSDVVRYTANYSVGNGPFTADANTRGLWHFDEGSGTTAADASPNHNHGTIAGGATWTTDNFFSVPDTAAPTVSGVTVTAITATTATVTWSTDEASSSQLRFGPTAAYGSTTTRDDVRLTTHGQSLTGLTPSTTYHVQAVSVDPFGNEAVSVDVSFATGPADSSAAVSGQWSPKQDWPLVAVHSVQLYTGEILMWDAWEIPSKPYVYNPTTGAFVEVSNPYGLFCAGHAILEDGRVAVFGGHTGSSGITGINTTFIFDPADRSWQRAPDMAYARWYPSATTLADGRALVLSGNIDSETWATTPEIYDPATNTVSQLTGISTADMANTLYPYAYLQPGGDVFVMSSEQNLSRLIDVNAQTYTPSVPLPLNVNSGSAAQYRPGKILVTGGGDHVNAGPSGNGAAVIDLTAGTPTVRPIPSMQQNRFQHTMTVLADGTVFTVGGSSIVDEIDTNGTRVPEIWDPATEVFTPVAPTTDLRLYHSTSMLLPDGRVLVAGGGRLPPAIDYPSAEIYSPPYLFKGLRPTIASAPANIAYGSAFTATSTEAASITKVSLHRLGSVTHTLDQGQHYVPLTFSTSGTELTINAPSDKGAAPGGYYMLTIVNAAGVPSVSKIVKLAGAAVADTQPPTAEVTAPTSGAALSGTVPLTSTLADNVGVVSAQYLIDGAAYGPAVTAAPWSSTWDSTSVSNGSHTVQVQARDAAGNTGLSPPVSVTVANASDTTAPTLSAIQATGVIATGATITWTTDEPASSQVDYGLDTVYGEGSGVNPALTTGHTVSITGLAADTTYHYRVLSHDGAGNLSVSADFTFTTPSPGFTLICNLTNPTSGATVSGTVTVTAAVTASNGAAGVQFKVDGANLGAEDTSSPYSAAWNTTTVGNGSHTVQAVVRDTVGNLGASDVSTVTVANVVPPNGLVAAYGFEEATGATTSDATGKGHTGTVSGATRTTSGKHGSALSFDGVNDLVTIADANDLDLTTGMTVSAWVRPTSLAGWRTVLLKEASGGLRYGIYAAGASGSRPIGTASIAGTDREAVGGASLPTNAWRHVTVSYDGSNLRFFVDGVQAGVSAVAGSIATSTSPLRIGGNNVWGEYFAGSIDDVRIYNRALSAAEIGTDMNTAVDPPTPDTVAPSAPGNLAAAGSIGEAALTWTASTDDRGVSGYRVHRSTSSGFLPAPGNQIATPTAPGYTDAVDAGTWYYKVVAVDAAGNVSPPSNEASAAVTADTTGPTVTVTGPADGASVSGAVALVASAADASGVASVQFRVDGANVGAADTASPYGASWDTAGLAVGSTHTIAAVALDSVGNPTTSTAVTVTIAAPPAGPVPVAAYNFDAGSGTALVDATGNGRTGTISGASWTAAGHTGSALTFDGVNDVVTIADHASLDLTNALTVEAWVRPTSTSGWRTLLMKERSGGLCYALYASGAGVPVNGTVAIGNTDREVKAPSALAVNTWSHVAMTFNGTTMRLYVNGTQVATKTASGSVVTSAGSLKLGGNSVWGEYFAGQLDDVRIYNQVLTAAQINTDRTTPVP